MTDSLDTVDLRTVAVILNIPRRTVNHYATTGVLPAIRIGLKYYVFKKDLDTWLRLVNNLPTQSD